MIPKASATYVTDLRLYQLVRCCLCDNLAHAKCAGLHRGRIDLIQNGFDYYNCPECSGFLNHIAYPMLKNLYFEPPTSRKENAAAKVDKFMTKADKPVKNRNNELRILSANVNGLRSKLDDSKLELQHTNRTSFYSKRQKLMIRFRKKRMVY
uniref:Uncharacterized protein n=1 Tax=Acrobeloides nanus TaxID=290746 RepID=A0A914DLG1_9BILA